MAKFKKFWDDDNINDNNNNRDDDISQTLQIYVAVAEFVFHYLIGISCLVYPYSSSLPHHIPESCAEETYVAKHIPYSVGPPLNIFHKRDYAPTIFNVSSVVTITTHYVLQHHIRNASIRLLYVKPVVQVPITHYNGALHKLQIVYTFTYINTYNECYRVKDVSHPKFYIGKKSDALAIVVGSTTFVRLFR